MSERFWRIRLVVEQCDPAGDSLEGNALMWAKEIGAYRHKFTFFTKRKAFARFRTISRMISKEEWN